MPHTPSRTLVLSLAVLMSGTSLAHAGFIWIAPEQQTAPGADTTFGKQPEAPAENAQGWTLAPDVPTAAAPTPLGQAPAQAAAPEVQTQPMEVAPAPAGAELTAPSTNAAPVIVSSTPPAAAPVIVSSAPPSAPQIAGEPVALSVETQVPAVSPPVPQTTLATSSMPTAEAMISDLPGGSAPPAQASAPQAPVSLVTGASIASETPPATAPVAPPAAPEPAAKVVDGFGKQVPLAIALRQILPANLGLAHADDVDLSQPVDWEGGKPWPEVLQTAIAPLGLSAAVTGDTVLLQKAGATTAMAAPTEPAPLLTPPPSTVSASVAGTKAVLTNATVMQTPPAE